MPSTRSRSQPTLPFPRRKSSRAMSCSKSSPQLEPEVPPPAVATVPAQSAPVSPRHAALKGAPLSPRLPLSPRKRMGDENGCNTPPCLLGSPPKQSRVALTSPLKLAASPNKLTLSPNKTKTGSPRKLSFDENTPVFSSPTRPQRVDFPLSPLSRQSPKRQETPCKSPRVRPEGKAVSTRLFSEQKSQYQSVKQALHTAVPERLHSREAERAAIVSFLESHVVPGLPSSLYVSGAPGTGKTACLNCVLQEREDLLKGVQKVVINCMTLRSSHSIFPLLAEKLGGTRGHSEGRLQKLLTSSGPTVLLVLDEMDQLDSKCQDVLYTIFEWPYLPRSRLCLIGIANALDLTDRILPRLQANPHCRPQLLHFPPYSRQELTAIVQDRLTQVGGDGVLDAAAVQFCARKVSAVSGDARKVLDICRRAVEMVESNERSKKSSDPTADAKAVRVSVPQVARVLSEVYGDRMVSGSGSEGESFPLQQKLLVCCLLLLTRSGKSREIPLGKLSEAYARLCAQRQVGGVGQGECLSLCSLLESQGIFSLKKAKEARLTKVSLKIEEKDVENALKDRALLGSILAAGLP
ncbi:cell division control protein 6 homolog [Clupea harengus]|uniref:Cell division control protein n=1 Tax=Clupea harengus TaxID=7950 RepID=A0A6P8F4Z3_CLUHA|nr:cell division control protein 6 homolog [Clupea harengus]